MEESLKNKTRELLKEFAELNLAIIRDVKKCSVESIDPQLLHELNINAQALTYLLFAVKTPID